MKELPKVSQLRTRPPRAAPPRRLAQQTLALRRARAALRNESARRQDAEKRLHQAASHDALTGLPNRSLLMDRLREGLERARHRPDHLLAVLFVDIDNFNVINDSLGHRFGDDLLIEAAQRLVRGLQSLNASLRPAGSLAARLGGDDFVILLDGLRSQGDAVAIAAHVQQHMAPLFSLGGREVGIGTSIGIALGGAGCQDASALLRSADTALFRAKLAGKARHVVFDERMHAETLQRFELENALRKALDRQQIGILYQPIVALDTGRIRSFEALLRWSHPQLGLIPPAEFVPVAEEIGLIARLGGWTLAEACRQLSRWQRQSSAAATLAINVNVSNRQLMEPDFCAQLEQVLLETGIGGRSLNLEITESTLVTASAALARRLSELKQLGVQLHMDDFGTGYSSLGYLHSSPFDVVKIDRSFVSNLSASREYTAVVHAIITLARNLNIKVTAEGLETEEQLAQILTLDCDYAQGYYFSEPIDAETAAALLAADGPWLTPRRARPEPLWFRSAPSRIAEAASLVHG